VLRPTFVFFEFPIRKGIFFGEIPVVHQDNQSGIRIAAKDFSNNFNMRHVDIRKMWIKQFIDEKKIVMSYTRTEDMVADGLTKPLTGANLKASYALLLSLGKAS
jgi:hypothetical protein